MPHVFLSDLTCQERREGYARVRYVFTDLDGTMMGPGSCVLKNAAGEPSLDFVSVLVELARAGIEVIPCSGRNRSMLHEDTRVLGLNSYIGEMGGLIMLDREHNEWEYFTADMPYDPADSRTPHEVIEAAGVCEEFVGRWPGMLEFHNDMSVGYKYREVTVGLRGEVDDAAAQAILDESGLPLDWVSNGYLTYISAPTTLALPEGVRGRAFNIQPRGLGKGRAISRFCERRGIDPAETLSIGDASSDFLMADATAQFILVENGLKDPGAEAFLAGHDNACIAHGRTIDAWSSAMRLVLEAVRGA